MEVLAESLNTLLEQMNSGRAAQALPELEQMLIQEPAHPGLLTLRAEALRLTGRLEAAVDAFKRAGESGGGPRNWLIAGVLLTNERKIDEALLYLQRALAQAPDDAEVLDALITALFNSNRHNEGIEFARRQIAVSDNPSLISRAALLLHANDLYEESTAAFGKVIALAPNEPAFAGSALVPTRFTCDWESVEALQRRIRDCYERGDFNAPQEYPLTNVTWCADEVCNLGVTRAYVARMVPRVETLPHLPAGTVGQRIRVGYISCDFRNHATMHLMAGLLETHDRRRFEIFAYDYSSPDTSNYRQRFLNAVEHHVPIHSLTDRQAAERIALDRVEILVDLKLYTGGGRAGVLAYRPAPIQAAYLGFPGSAASTDIDYIVSDRFVTPDSSAPHYSEKFCRLPHSYQCNDRQRFVAPKSVSRTHYGLPEDKVVFGAFNQSYKIDRGSFAVWLRVLREVPDSILWLLGQSPAAVANLTRYTQLAGVDPNRIVFAPFAQPTEHLTRLQLADAVLDALVCNGHTTTSDALWVGVPVITARGRHFASRVSESLLNAMELPELVGCDEDDMVRIAKRIGTDSSFRAKLRAEIAVKRHTAPLFDTARFTRDFELALESMVQRHRDGLPPAHIDVPENGQLAPGAPTPNAADRMSALQVAYPHCPLCDGASATLGFAPCTAHVLWHEPLPTSLEWLRCTACEHVHSRHHWSEAGVAQVARRTVANRPTDTLATPEARAGWSPVVEKVASLLGGYRAIVDSPSKPIWVDIGCGDGALVMSAVDYGFAAIGLDTESDAVSHLQQLGFNALQRDFMTLKFEVTPEVVSMADVLALLPHPLEALRKAAEVLRPGGVLMLSTPDLSSSEWRVMEAGKTNPGWMDLERFHVFSRDRLIALLGNAGFEVCDLSVSARAKGHVELYAVRKAKAPPRNPARESRVRLNLNDVTVCAADCSTPSLAAWALAKSTTHCAFGDAILFTDEPAASHEFRTVRIQALKSRSAYSRFVLKELVEHIRTPYVLIVQWDGYVVEPKAWLPEFCQYDWIGARWPWYTDGMTVGNGGFSLRSRRLLEITGSSWFELKDNVEEDDLVCRVNRPELMRKYQIRFAPEQIADRFSYEHTIPSLPTFGFHAPFNMWRHVDDSEMVELANGFTPQILRSDSFVRLLSNYAETRRFKPLEALYSRWRQECTPEEIRAQTLRLSASEEYSNALLSLCEPLGRVP
jgi:protein O-GlcNAc transferase